MIITPRHRPFNWVHLLLDFVSESRDMPFAWGTNDCFMFAARWYLRVRERDVRAGHEDINYDDALGAARLVKRFGGMQSLGTEAFGPALEYPLFAQRGDIVLVEHVSLEPFGGSAFMVLNTEAMLGPGEKGLIGLPYDPDTILAAWAV